MEPVIIMVSCGNSPEVFDIEVMPDTPAVDLADAIGSALKWAGTYDIEIGSSGRKMNAQQCLAEVGLWDGARLRLVPSNRPARRAIMPENMQPYNKQTDANAVVDAQPNQPGGNGLASGSAVPAPPPSSPLLGWKQPGFTQKKKS